MKYDPWGGTRETTGELGMDYTYTGQRSEAALGLMYYVARWYDSGIGHFVQADTIVPGAGNPAAWNRYGYTVYNPVKYMDPSGHIPVIDDPELYKVLQTESEKEKPALSEDRSIEGNSQTNGCPSEFPDCRFFYNGEVTQDQLIGWREWLSTRKKMVYGGDLCTKIIVQGVVILLVTIPVVGPYITIGGEMTLPPLTDTALDYQQDEFDTLINYIDGAIGFAESNNGVVHITIGNPKSADEWGSSIFIQYDDQDSLILNTPVAVLEVFWKSLKWKEQ
jgi:RHS repeat-associated protein